jgi:methanethiol S-methyltransferase
MKRVALVVYSVIAYATFLASVLLAMGFFADLVTPWPIDREPGAAGFAPVVDLGLLLIFAAQHSVMARPAFKRMWRHLVPDEAERSTYVLLASGILILLFWLWQPMPGTVWRTTWAPAVVVIMATYWAGWVIVVSSTFMINHFDLFGLRQAYLYARSREYSAPQFMERWLYHWVRHPMMFGLLIVFWATPRMSPGHLLFAVGATIYIVVGTLLEEHDLRASLGAAYREYASRVPAFVPLRHLLSGTARRSVSH